MSTISVKIESLEEYPTLNGTKELNSEPMKKRVFERLLGRASTLPVPDYNKFVKDYVKEHGNIWKIQELIDDAYPSSRRLSPLLSAHKEKTFHKELEKVFTPKQQAKIFKALGGPEPLTMAILSKGEVTAMARDIEQCMHCEEEIKEKISTALVLESFDEKKPLKAILPADIFDTFRSFLRDEDEKSGYFSINSKELVIPTFRKDMSETEKKREITLWLMKELDSYIPKSVKEGKKSIEEQVDLLFSKWDFSSLRTRLKKQLSEGNCTKKELRAALKAERKLSLLHLFLPDIIDFTESSSSEEVAEQVYDHLNSNKPVTDCFSDIPCYPILQRFSFSAWAGAEFALRDQVFPQFKGVIKKDPEIRMRYEFEFDKKDFEVTHVKWYQLRDSAGAPLAEMEVYWSLQGRLDKESKSKGHLSCKNFSFLTNDMEKRKEIHKLVMKTKR